MMARRKETTAGGEVTAADESEVTAAVGGEVTAADENEVTTAAGGEVTAAEESELTASADRADEDDGRTIADMSQVERPSLLGHFPAGGHADSAKRENTQNNVPEQPPFTKEERRWIVLGALKAALLIGFAFIGGLGLVILLLMLIWRIL